MHDDITSLPTLDLIREATVLELKIIHDTSSAMETERFCLIQVELGGRLARDLVVDPRD